MKNWKTIVITVIVTLLITNLAGCGLSLVKKIWKQQSKERVIMTIKPNPKVQTTQDISLESPTVKVIQKGENKYVIPPAVGNLRIGTENFTINYKFAVKGNREYYRQFKLAFYDNWALMYEPIQIGKFNLNGGGGINGVYGTIGYNLFGNCDSHIGVKLAPVDGVIKSNFIYGISLDIW